MGASVSVLIMSKPGSLRIGLQALFSAIPAVQAIVLAEDLRAVMAAASEQRPAIALLVAEGSGDQARLTIQEVKRVSPGTKCILLIENVIQPSKDGDVADAVLLHGTSPDELVAAIERLLEPDQEGKEQNLSSS